jgi:hypothetical protein
VKSFGKIKAKRMCFTGKTISSATLGGVLIMRRGVDNSLIINNDTSTSKSKLSACMVQYMQPKIYWNDLNCTFDLAFSIAGKDP